MNKKKLLLVLTTILIGLMLYSSQARVSDKEWHLLYQQFISEYTSSGGKQDPDIRINALQYLADADHPKLVTLLTTAVIPFELEQEAPIVFDMIAQIIGQFKDEATITKLIKTVKTVYSPVKIPLIMGMGRLEHPKVIEQLIKFAGDRKPNVQTAAINALAYSQPEEALPTVIKALDTKAWEVRASAINYLARVKDDESKKLAIEALRNHQGKESGRLKADISQALSRLTKKDKPPSSTHGGTIAKFYGLSIESKNVIFVVDISGSMSGPSQQGGATKMEVLKKELIGAIKRLAGPKGYGPKSDAKFNIITFHSTVAAWKKELVSARQYGNEAIKWVKRLQPQGTTNLYDALELAFGFASKGKSKGKGYYQKRGADTIFVMSDGSPCAGKYQKPDEILRAVRILNQTRQIKINTISVKPSNLSFMKRLAEENNGTHIEK